MRSLPLVSVNIRTWNSGKTIKESLESVKRQTYSNVEIIICDGFSRDNTVKIATPYATKIDYADKLGDARVQNYKNSNGKYILSLDSDQVLDKKVIEECVKICENDKIDAVIISEKSIIGKGVLLEKLIAYDKWVIDQNRDSDLVFGSACPRFFRKEMLDGIKWPKELAMLDDTILYAELLRQGAKVAYLPTQSIRHHEVTSWMLFIEKFYRYGKGYARSFKTEPTTVTAHSLPRRSYFSKAAFSKPHYFAGLILLYLVKAVSAGAGAFSQIFIHNNPK